MNKQLQAAEIIMTADRAKEYLDDAIDAIEDHYLEFAYRRTKLTIDLLVGLQRFDARVSRAVDLVTCFLTLDCLEVAEIRKAQKNLEAVAAIGRTMIGEDYMEAQACAS